MECYFFLTREPLLRDEDAPREAVLLLEERDEELVDRLRAADVLRLPEELDRGADRADEVLRLLDERDCDTEGRDEELEGLLRTTEPLGLREEEEEEGADRAEEVLRELEPDLDGEVE